MAAIAQIAADRDRGEEAIVDPALLRFLMDPANYPTSRSGRPGSVGLIESHMSLVFLVGDRAYKMKKPIRLGSQDYRSLDHRRMNCERELSLNRELAPDIYRSLEPLVRDHAGCLRWDGEGDVVEWFVVMRRLDDELLLDHAIAEGRVGHEDIERLIAVLVPFYGRPQASPPPDLDLLGRWAELHERNRQSLQSPMLALPDHEVDRVLKRLARFLDERSDLLLDRARAGWIRDCHGDLRPQHVHLGPPLRLIDRLEFDECLRWCDPYEEIVDLGLECERMGAPWILPLLIDGVDAELGGKPDAALLAFYAGMRACLRARLAIDHLRHGHDGRAEQWRARAIAGIELARRYVCDQL